MKPDPAGRQAEEEKNAAAEAEGPGTVLEPPSSTGYGEGETPGGGERTTPGDGASAARALPKQFFRTVKLNPDRLNRDAGKIAAEVLQHFTTLKAACVEVKLDIEAQLPEGIEESIHRILLENAPLVLNQRASQLLESCKPLRTQ